MNAQPGILYIDTFEPSRIVAGAEPVVPTQVTSLNLEWDKADYYLIDPLGNQRMIERKQISEALSDLDGLEEQLGRHLHHCDELTLLVEGVAKPMHNGVQTYLYKGGIWVEGYFHEEKPGTKKHNLWARWNAFKYILWHDAGVHVEEVSHWQGTLTYLITWFKRANDPESQMLKRYIIPHMPPFHKNPHIDNLMRLKGFRIGQTTAVELINEFGTFAAVMNARRSDLVAVKGGAWTRNFFEVTGRED